MKLTVKKFGGTSVGTLERIRHVADHCAAWVTGRPAEQLIVVVSAMAGETNRLLALARDLTPNPASRELDVLATSGEQVSAALVAMALQARGIDAQSVLAPQARIATDGRFTDAQITSIDPQPLKELLARGVTPVVAGFQGVTTTGELTTLGRGGSDITAVAVAAALKAECCYIYTDVDGVYATDPRLCTQARKLTRVSHEEMLEMASLGAKVLHSRSVYLAMRYQVPLVVLSSVTSRNGTPSEGTWIVPEIDHMEAAVVSGVTHRVDEAKVTVLGIAGGGQALARLFTVLAEAGIQVDMITQEWSGESRMQVSFTVPDEVSVRALQIAQDLVPSLNAIGAALDRDIAKVSVVGLGMRYHTGVAAKLFQALADQGIEVQMVTTSEIKISVAVRRKYCEAAVRGLHRVFLE